ncbi:hypothetical protein OYE22_19275 [Streptomyces sp. 71268]|uniref:hypothetical protein n=1 Tax=Streptomyces sp. 71268 TaxID=3002640 RepID=UPI0023F74881|nr:hypothetical protein [Streptomyces sp. 71268]WEV27099.1 hypothetical protein OYE22_19275 [Streptomyces sp. 71268]
MTGARVDLDDGLRGKARFDEIYDLPDPRGYFRTLRPLAYQIPHHAQEVFQQLLAARVLADASSAQPAERPPTVVDLCCSYGINAALLKHKLTLDELYERYTDPRLAALTSDQLIASDRRFFAERRLPDAARVVGLDAAKRAVGYARTAGLLDEAFGEDLERADPGPELRRAVAGAGLVTVTGGIGYITSRTVSRLAEVIEGPLWVAAFVLRGVSYEPVAEALRGFGLVTETAGPKRTFVQRRFADVAERRHAIAGVVAAGADPRGKEDQGYYHAQLYVSRPAAHVAAFPLADFVGDGGASPR